MGVRHKAILALHHRMRESIYEILVKKTRGPVVTHEGGCTCNTTIVLKNRADRSADRGGVVPGRDAIALAAPGSGRDPCGYRIRSALRPTRYARWRSVRARGEFESCLDCS